MTNKINLSGEWGFRADEEMLGLEKEYYALGGNDTINMPSTTSISKKGKENPKAETGYLTDAYAYEGYAWFYKTVNLGGAADGKNIRLFLERTRLTTVWINGVQIGTCDSLCTPHIYDITDYVSGDELDIAVMVSNTGYPTKGGHMTSPDTQSNWNGITGEISLIISEKERIADVQAYPDTDRRAVKLRFSLEGTDSADIIVWGASSDSRIVDKQSFHVSGSICEIEVDLGKDAALWSEHTPVTYTLDMAIDGSADIAQVTFGLRSFKADGMHFAVNGVKTQLRGKHDGMIFPLTGAAPTTVEEWMRILGISKSWGINHYRFHTCCPPEAAFTAADLLGIYMQPELPFWGTVTSEKDENHNETEQQYLIEEGRRILRTFGNHPSFVMMSLGNELWGSAERMAEILREYHSLDDRHLYTQGSNNFQFWPNILPEDDFFSGVRLSRDRLIRGSYAMCDAPLGFVQTEEPDTSHSYDKLIVPEASESDGESGAQEIEIQYGTGVKKVKIDSASSGLIPSKPVVTHEVGQYAVYPDFKEIEKYTGVLKARNFEVFRERLSDKGMLSQADDFFRASGKLSAACYKLEIEAAMRSELIAGFQLLDLQDFSGQGTALVGMLDAFMDSKGLIEREDWNGFCSDAVILAELDSFVVTAGEKLDIPVKFRYTGAEAIRGKKIRWNASVGGDSFAHGEIDVPDNFYGLGQLGSVNIEIPGISDPQKITLAFEIKKIRRENDYLPEDSRNSYDLWAYLKPSEAFAVSGKSVMNGNTVYVTENLDEAKKHLADGSRVIYLPNELSESIEGFYCTDFWCYPMFRSISESMNKAVPVGTMGLLIDKAHPALSGFPSEDYSTPQWYHIVTNADCAVLDSTCAEFKPIVQMIDNFERNHKLGILYEARVGAGRLLVCTSRLSEIADRPEVQAFARSIIEYTLSDEFDPKYELTPDMLCLEKEQQ
ncbi:MAG: beta-glucuronidase [Ruminococcus sp.]|nr:beta-glucuronidase [Ruminococcus sp.]